MIAKKNVLSNPNQFLHAARFVLFFMTFVMLFIVPLSPFLVGCQSMRTTERGPNETRGVAASMRPSNSTVVRAIHDAMVGGSGGEEIALQMDKHANALKVGLKGAQVERIGEGILITFDSQTIFDDDSFEIQWVTKSKLKNLVKVLDTCGYINALIEAHTDNMAEESYNYFLSDKRASAVADYLVSQGLDNARIKARGFGEKQPLVANDTETGKRANRRVEVALYVNDQIRMLALNGTLGEYIASKR